MCAIAARVSDVVSAVAAVKERTESEEALCSIRLFLRFGRLIALPAHLSSRLGGREMPAGQRIEASPSVGVGIGDREEFGLGQIRRTTLNRRRSGARRFAHAPRRSVVRTSMLDARAVSECCRGTHWICMPLDVAEVAAITGPSVDVIAVP